MRLIKTGIVILIQLLLIEPGRAQENTDFQFIELNSIEKNASYSLRTPTINLLARSTSNEVVKCILKSDGVILYEFDFELEFGLNKKSIDLTPFINLSDKDHYYNLLVRSKQFGKMMIRVNFDLPPILTPPAVGIMVNPTKLSCDFSLSEIELVGSVKNGVPPYDLTWFISDGEKLEDLLMPPLQQKMTSAADISRIFINEPLQYYVTLLVKDNCGNIGKKVLLLRCTENEEDGYLYFQPLEINPGAEL